MKNSEKYLLHYLTANYSNTAKWGILCTTVGYQIVAPRCHYPLSIHPDNYNFKSTLDLHPRTTDKIERINL